MGLRGLDLDGRLDRSRCSSLVWLLVREPGAERPRDDALDILRARFARGEISQEEFERARDALLADRGNTTR